MALSVKDHMAIAIAGRHYKYAAVRDAQVLDQLGMTPARFSQYVLALIERPDALAAYPRETRRLQRLRDQRRARAS